jgi:phosphate transport system substrate-binding protein
MKYSTFCSYLSINLKVDICCKWIGQWKRASLALILLLGISFLLSACGGAGDDPSDSTDSSGDPQRSIQNKGSDTLVNIALAWAETYRDVEPDVSIAVTGGGSGTGIAALINGTVDIANASRSMKEKEVEEARANGIEPVEHVVAIDALAIITNLENPVSELTIQQLSDMYTGRITNWKDVGGNDAPIILLSRETNSGTHVYFLEEVVRRGEKENEDIFAPQTLLMPSSVGITSEVRRNPNSIGYDGLGYVDAEHEKIISIAAVGESDFIPPTVQTASDGIYPLARNLFMYTAGEPADELADYLNWILSKDGQDIVAQLGFVPLVDS